MNADLFSTSDTCISIDIPDGSLDFYPRFIDIDDADKYFRDLMDIINWKVERITVYGKTYDVPRLSAWYADEGRSYEYSGTRVEPNPWIPILLKIKNQVEFITGERFNSVLVNQYRDGADGVAWHSDDEIELGKDPVIASVSFGQERQFQLKHRYNKGMKKSLILPHGSLILMGKGTHLNWFHQIPKSKQVMKPRINLTFRNVV